MQAAQTSTEYASKPLYDLFLSIKQLMIFEGVFKKPIISTFCKIIDTCMQEEPDSMLLFETYHTLIKDLINWRETFNGYLVGSLWKDYVIRCLLEDENIFTQKVEQQQVISTSLQEAVKHDLRIIQDLCFCNPDNLKQLVLKHLKQSKIKQFHDVDEDNLPNPDYNENQNKCHDLNLTPLQERVEKRIHQVMLELYDSKDWTQNLHTIKKYIQDVGVGIFTGNIMFRWISTQDSGYLAPAIHPDPVRLKDLVGYETQRAEIITNTIRFVHGYPANNVLLYGDRGTGKSSTVKALVNEYATTGKGLRLIEVSRDDLSQLPEITHLLAKKPQRFIIFVDDLSFTDGETGYRNLKAILEGSTETLPDNTLIYATSNRRHFVKESISDNTEYRDEIRIQDSIQEKLSLADRFGITAVFLLPSRQKYLQIVEALAEMNGIDIPKDELHKRALEWEVKRNGRSPRSAHQFIRDLQGELILANHSNDISAT
jgi:predicted AAA+ superfamily ATPase